MRSKTIVTYALLNRPWIKPSQPRAATMPRYHFNVVGGDGSDLVSDPEGVVLSSRNAARRKAVALARDMVRDGLVHEPTERWKIVVTGENGDVILRVPLSRNRGWTWTLWHPRELIAGSTWFLGATPSERFAASAGLGLAVQGALLAIFMIVSHGTTYQTASSRAGHGIVAARFAPQASPAAIAEFLNRYKAEVIGTPAQGGFYRLQIRDQSFRGNELPAVLSRMMRESIVELAASSE
jgi:hypothetical protein